MGRFEDAETDVVAFVNGVRRSEGFTALQGAEIKIIFDLKKRTSGGKIVLGRMKKANELEKHLTADAIGNGEGCDYIMYLDKKAWDLADEDQRTKLVRHELRHCNVDIDSATNPYKVKGHDIEDFEEEIRLNADNPGWASQLAEVVELSYQQDREANR